MASLITAFRYGSARAFLSLIGLLILPVSAALSISACNFCILPGCLIRKYRMARRAMAVVSLPAKTYLRESALTARVMHEVTSIIMPYISGQGNDNVHGTHLQRIESLDRRESGQHVAIGRSRVNQLKLAVPRNVGSAVQGFQREDEDLVPLFHLWKKNGEDWVPQKERV